MTLSDFEKELENSKSKDSRSSHAHRKRDRSRSRERDHRRSKDSDRHRHRHGGHDSSHRRRSRDRDEDSKHRHKRSRHQRNNDDARRDREKPRPSKQKVDHNESEDEWVEKDEVPPVDDTLDQQLEDAAAATMSRDTWMEAPSALDVDYVNRRKEPPKEKTTRSTQADYRLKIHKNELNHLLKDLQESSQLDDPLEEPVTHEVSYTFGDAGSQWRMTKLKAVYRQAKETGKSVEDVALERYGSLRDFDDAREEEQEMERRKIYGVGKEKPSGELYQERKLAAGHHRAPRSPEHEDDLPQGEIMPEQPPPGKTMPLDQSALNKLKAQAMKAKLKGASNADQLEAEYLAMAELANSKEPGVVVLNQMENRMLASGRKGEVKQIENRRGRERGLVEENEDMTIEDMVRQERRTKGHGFGLSMAERIAKDAKFDTDLDYMDENAEKLAKRVDKSELNLRNMAISEFQMMNRILDTCPLCYHEDTNKPPVAPVVSLGTRSYLTLPTEPELSDGGACIVPLQHRINLMECDDDEWEEIRNFMKCLTRLYHDQGRDVIFYENAAAPHRKRHAAMQAVPIPFELGETAPAFFREAILAADEEWTQHKKLIDTAKRAKEGLGKMAFRRTLVKEMPYFHAWFDLDGGLGHVIEDENRWPKGDLFAREVIGGMLDAEPDVIKKQGRWRSGDKRVDGFRKHWKKFDWTRMLTDA